jgi:hypothetical protein
LFIISSMIRDRERDPLFLLLPVHWLSVIVSVIPVFFPVILSLTHPSTRLSLVPESLV